MSDEQRPLTDDMPLSDLTIGEFKQLMADILAQASPVKPEKSIDPPIEKVSIRRKSLDEFMNDLGSKNS